MDGRKKGLNKEKEVFVVIKTTCKWPARPRKSDSLKETSYQASPPTPSAAWVWGSHQIHNCLPHRTKALTIAKLSVPNTTQQIRITEIMTDENVTDSRWQQSQSKDELDSCSKCKSQKLFLRSFNHSQQYRLERFQRQSIRIVFFV